MTKEARKSKSKTAREDQLASPLIFRFRYSFEIRHLDFVIIHSLLPSATTRFKSNPSNRGEKITFPETERSRPQIDEGRPGTAVGLTGQGK